MKLIMGHLVHQSTYMALCFLPTNHIPALFDQLKREASTESIHFLMEYMRKIWISRTAPPPPSTWSVYGLIICTYNDVEGWHDRLNKRGCPHVPFYVLIMLYRNEARPVHFQVRPVTESKLKSHQEKKYRELQKKISTYWRNVKMTHAVH